MSFKCAVGIEIGDGGTSNKSEIQTSKNKIDHNNSGKKKEDTSDMENLQNNRMSIDRPHLSGFDIPLDAFSLHHPFLQSHIQEFEFSDWYFLFFTLFYKNNSQSPVATSDVSILVPELTKALSSKLSVPANIFSISKAEKYRSNSISANISISNHTIPHLHHKLTNLHNISPLFWLKGVRYKLVQVIHDKNQHLFVKNDGKNFSNKELGLLIIVTLGGIIIFLVLVMLALLNVKLFFVREQNRDLEHMIKDENEEGYDCDPEEGAIFTIDRKVYPSADIEPEINNEPLLTDASWAPDTREARNNRQFNTNIIKKLKYCKTLF